MNCHSIVIWTVIMNCHIFRCYFFCLHLPSFVLSFHLWEPWTTFHISYLCLCPSVILLYIFITQIKRLSSLRLHFIESDFLFHLFIWLSRIEFHFHKFLTKSNEIFNYVLIYGYLSFYGQNKSDLHYFVYIFTWDFYGNVYFFYEKLRF